MALLSSALSITAATRPDSVSGPPTTPARTLPRRATDPQVARTICWCVRQHRPCAAWWTVPPGAARSLGARLAGFFWGGPGGVLISPPNGRIDERILESFVLAVLHPLPKALPQHALFPLTKALVDGIPVSELIGQVTPWGL